MTAIPHLEACSDVELVAAISAGDAAAFEVLYLRYRDWVVALAYRFTGDSDSALDILQDTFVYVLKKFPGFRLTAQFKTFLYPVVRNLSLAARRKATRYQASTAELERLERSPAPEPARTEPGDLAYVLAWLPEEQREVLMLRFVDGLNLADIAGAMEIPLGTVKSRLHNALQALRQDERTQKFFER